MFKKFVAVTISILVSVQAFAGAVPHFETDMVKLPGFDGPQAVVRFNPAEIEKSKYFTTTIEGKNYLIEVDTVVSSPTGIYLIKERSITEIEFDKNGEMTRVGPTQYQAPSDAPTGGNGLAKEPTGLGSGILSAGKSGLLSGLGNGLSVYAYRKLVYDDKYKKKLAELTEAERRFVEARNQANKEIGDEILADQINLDQAVRSLDGLQQTIERLQNSFKLKNVNLQHQFKSKDPKFVAELSSIRDTLLSSPRTDSQGLNIRNVGIEFTELADQSFSEGEFVDAEAFKEYATSMADLLFGIDPITGVARDVFEAFSGFNLITGEKLSEFERGMAMVGMVTFGYGSKIARGMKGLSRISSALKSSETVSKAMEHARQSLDAFGESKIFQKYQLWRTEGFLHKSNPALLEELRNHPKGDVYLKHLSDRKNLKVPDRNGSGKFIEQELSLEALEAIDSVQKSGWVVRQGKFGFEDADLKEFVRQNPHADVRGLEYGSKITIGHGVQDHSVYFGKVTKDVGSASYALRQGAYSLNPDFVEVSKLGPKAEFVTRRAPSGLALDPATGKRIVTPGGAIEVIVRPGGIEKSSLILIQSDTTTDEIAEIISRRMNQ